MHHNIRPCNIGTSSVIELARNRPQAGRVREAERGPLVRLASPRSCGCLKPASDAPYVDCGVPSHLAPTVYILSDRNGSTTVRTRSSRSFLEALGRDHSISWWEPRGRIGPSDPAELPRLPSGQKLHWRADHGQPCWPHGLRWLDSQRDPQRDRSCERMCAVAAGSTQPRDLGSIRPQSAECP